MTLAERIDADIKEAMRAREAGKDRLAVLRLAKAAIKNQEIANRRPLADDETLAVLSRELKQRREVLPDYERSGRSDLVEQLKREMTVLEAYLPTPLTDDELKTLIAKIIAETGATGMREIGKVMPRLMAEVKGKADGKRVNALVKEQLEAR